ncbi:inorganic phosphate transporter [Flavobacterium sp. NRK F10]|uniref:5-bromo-4-chloroindolyl phosphate hydrolysis family protein n=1 Tax=Flavobacterium sp. NRK F10 TaxID=2954931 RepID=UPI0020909A99|nr:5-bromo-4-chloroindolyl phosphate hydrolysis family protein [Flavobacterium sp. NRK F10]MCO6175173.1 inorganic phosphate transporter [Flavobacterium sp. NRK F10]
MEQVYIVMLVALAILAIIDLMVGVANDAVNFLNSGIGSKAVSFKTLMIVASIGVALGALFSSGMMEIARSGIFVPSMFTFEDVMIIFLAVMITDVLLLDIFNSLGFPTSTTVSVVFELLGGAVCLAIYKIVTQDGDINTLASYINTAKASEIVSSILLSVIISFTVGAIVMYISRIVFSFHYERRIKYFGAIFGGIGITAITYFILFKGIKSSSFMTAELKDMMKANQVYIILGNFVFWAIFSQIVITLKQNIFKIIIIIGTFALALAFAGNDLVNFIGVPIAALQSHDIFVANGRDANMLMGALASNEIRANFWLLLFGGGIMVYTLWTSKKAREVIKTGVDLSRQSEGSEKFDANNLSRIIVRGSIYVGQMLNYVMPKALEIKIDRQFEAKKYEKKEEKPAFDMVRAAVNLMVASILIAVGTSLKLPLSTTYVTFMVAMGTSFADRAWDRESAVYRVAGVFNVIGGWFVTAIVAFTMAVTVVFLLKVGKVFAFVGLMILVGILLYRSGRKYLQRSKEQEEEAKLKREDIATIKEVMSESSAQIARVINKAQLLYTDVVNNLGLQDLNKLKDSKKKLKKLEKDVDELKGNVYYFIKNLDETSVEGSKFYILILGYLQDMVQSIGYITNNSYQHINNNHKNLKFNQIRDLKSVDAQLHHLFVRLQNSFAHEKFEALAIVLEEKDELLNTISELIQKQITRIRTTENSPKNSKLYFGLLLETNDLIKATMNLLELFQEFDKHVKTKNGKMIV